MKNLFASLCLFALVANYAVADIKITFDETPSFDKIIVSHNPIKNMLKAKSEQELGVINDTINISNNSATITTNLSEPEYFLISSSDNGNRLAKLYIAPNENLNVNLTSLDGEYSALVSGTELMDGIEYMSAKAKPYEEILIAIQQGTNTSDNFEEVLAKYYSTFTDFLDNNPDNTATTFALLNTSGETFLKYYSLLGENVKKSILYPFVEQQHKATLRQVEAERLQNEMQNGTYTAPDFSLPNMNGEIVRLSDFKGKWVVLDFWGSWCKWCIKGFPEMKEAYKRHTGKVEFIGIDCGDTKERWINAVNKYELPWINLYNDTENVTENRPDQNYAIQGYPTKIIISPEGKIAKIVTGEDPQFYTDLDNLLKAGSIN